MTAYRQRALICAASVAGAPQRPRDLRPIVPDCAARLCWTMSMAGSAASQRGVYGLTDAGRAALERWPRQAPPAFASKAKAAPLAAQI